MTGIIETGRGGGERRRKKGHVRELVCKQAGTRDKIEEGEETKNFPV